jgi:hypothetical protein
MAAAAVDCERRLEELAARARRGRRDGLIDAVAALKERRRAIAEIGRADDLAARRLLLQIVLQEVYEVLLDLDDGDDLDEDVMPQLEVVVGEVLGCDRKENDG